MSEPVRAEVVVDLAAVRHNVRALRALVAEDGAALMTVVKADGYGHGMLPAAAAARAGGAEWLGVATPGEALKLRAGGDTGRILCWLGLPGEDYSGLVAADVDVTASSVAQLDEVAAGVRAAGRPARLQLKVDTGLARNGAVLDDWPALVAAARAGEEDGRWRVTGIWSHFACADEPTHPANDAQESAFRAALDVAAAAGLRPELRHLANSAAAVLRPSARFDLVRCGLASYGLDPAPDVRSEVVQQLGLRPAMAVRAPLALAKPVARGAGVSYGHTWSADRPTSVGLVPLGYADGVPWHAGNAAETWVDGERRAVRGRVCMDQFLVDLDGALPPRGSEVLVFGSGARGEPTAQDWARWCGTISYEIVTRMGGRLGRAALRHIDTEEEASR